jgi:hypothetical protein
MSGILYFHFGTPLKCINYVVPTYLNLRIYFIQAMNNNSALTSTSTYSISALSGPAITPTVSLVTAESVTNPTYVDLTCSNLTHGQLYRVTITSGVLRNGDLGPYYYDGLTADYYGVSVGPDVITLVATSTTTMRLVFSNSMTVDGSFLSPASYSFSRGLSVTGVSLISATTVTLTTSEQLPFLYTLTVPTSFSDIYLNSMNDNTITVTGIDSSPAVVPGEGPSSVSYRLSDLDRTKLEGLDEIVRPDENLLLPHDSSTEEEIKVSSNDRLKNTKSSANKILDKIDSLSQKIDRKCGRFSVSSNEGRGSPLFQAMVRTFGERTTTITYAHYTRALEYRRLLAQEDTERMRLQ